MDVKETVNEIMLVVTQHHLIYISSITATAFNHMGGVFALFL